VNSQLEPFAKPIHENISMGWMLVKSWSAPLNNTACKCGVAVPWLIEA